MNEMAIQENMERLRQYRIRRKRQRSLTIIALVIILVIVVSVLSFFVVKSMGKSSLYNNASSEGPVISLEYGQVREDENWKEGMVAHNGALYEYDENILTFLILGIDDNGEVTEAEDGISGGQSDAIFLAVCNPTKKKIEVIAVNRNTMTEIARYDETGEYLWDEVAQIAVQHGYGDGLETSCERTVQAVSKLFYDLPIHGYASINMGGITDVNDALGGVEVTMEQDTVVDKYFYKQGETVLLKGKEAYWFLRDRDVNEFDSATARLNRQKQYIVALIHKMIQVMKEDVTVVGDLYQIAKEYSVTDVSVEEATYMATTISTYDFSMENMHSMKGEVVRGEVYEEFYPDTEAMYELVIDVFYKEVE